MKVVSYRAETDDDKISIEVRGEPGEYWIPSDMRILAEQFYIDGEKFRSGAMFSMPDYSDHIWISIYPDAIHLTSDILAALEERIQIRDKAPEEIYIKPVHRAVAIQAIWDFNSKKTLDVPFKEPEDSRFSGEYERVGMEAITKADAKLYDDLLGKGGWE